jgi:hypothetical protein
VTNDLNFKIVLEPSKVEFISLTDPASCIRTLTTVRGGLAIIDDGSIPNLAALSRVRSIVGPLFIYGRANASLTSLAGLEALQVTNHELPGMPAQLDGTALFLT